MALCFRDREFCSAACTNTLCVRNLNDAVHAEARRWWGDLPGGPPIAMRDMSEGCEHYQPEVVAEA
jgi:hypothetical protein